MRQLHFAFALFDVDESLELGRDEAVVLLSSSIAALARLSQEVRCNVSLPTVSCAAP